MIFVVVFAALVAGSLVDRSRDLASDLIQAGLDPALIDLSSHFAGGLEILFACPRRLLGRFGTVIYSRCFDAQEEELNFVFRVSYARFQSGFRY